MGINKIMNPIIVFAALFAFGIAIVLWKLIQGRNRRNRLRQAGKISTWESIECQPKKYGKIVQANFGNGDEIWVLVGDGGGIDLTLRAFQTGVLVCPRPSQSKIVQYCEKHGMTFSRTMVKLGLQRSQ